jgi:hypothetical protein
MLAHVRQAYITTNISSLLEHGLYYYGSPEDDESNAASKWMKKQGANNNRRWRSSRAKGNTSTLHFMVST